MLYHKDIGFPRNLDTRTQTIKLYYTEHAMRAACSDRYGDVLLPRVLDTSKAQLIEVECDALGFIEKGLYRVKLTKKLDLVLAVTAAGSVKTAWLNQAGDTHGTLDRAKYAVPAA